LVSHTSTAVLGPRVAPELIAIKLNGLTRLASKVVNNHGLYCHLTDISGVRAIQLSTQNLREVVIKEHFSLSSSTQDDYLVKDSDNKYCLI
jgi:hypothetical protein